MLILKTVSAHPLRSKFLRSCYSDKSFRSCPSVAKAAICCSRWAIDFTPEGRHVYSHVASPAGAVRRGRMSTRVNHVVRSAPPNGAGAVVAEGYKHGTPSGVKIYKLH